MRQNAPLAMALFWVATIPTALVAADPPDELVPQIAEVSISPTVAEWVPVVGNLSFRLSISGPRGLTLDREFTAGEVPTFAAWDEHGRSLPDGVYEYELRAVPAAGQDAEVAGLALSGSLVVREGAFEPLAVPPRSGGPAPTDLVIEEDLLVDAHACIGEKCIDEGQGENWGWLTLRGAGPHIVFDDVFDGLNAAHDWMIQINDFPLGGAEHFSIRDGGAFTTPFRIFGNAPEDSLIVASSGNVGLGTSTPAAALHLERDGTTANAAFLLENTGGAVPKIWFVQNQATNGALVFTPQPTGTAAPLKVFYGAPENSLVVGQNSGGTSPRVGMHRVAFISHPLHVGTDATNGNGAHVTAAGVWTDGSSRAHKCDISPLDGATAVAVLADLVPVSYRGRDDPSGEEYLGFIAEDVPELVAMEDRQGLSPMDLVALLTRVVQEQQRRLETQDGEIAELSRRLGELLERIE